MEKQGVTIENTIRDTRMKKTKLTMITYGYNEYGQVLEK